MFVLCLYCDDNDLQLPSHIKEWWSNHQIPYEYSSQLNELVDSLKTEELETLKKDLAQLTDAQKSVLKGDKLNIAVKMREILPILRNGISGVHFSDLQPKREDSWDENYAIVKGLYYTNVFGYVPDEYNLQLSFEKRVIGYFPDCGVILYWSSQEIEVWRDD